MSERASAQENVESKVDEVLHLAGRAWQVGAEVAVVHFMVGSWEADAWDLVFRVQQLINARLRSGTACKCFGPPQKPPGENLRGHFEIRRTS